MDTGGQGLVDRGWLRTNHLSLDIFTGAPVRVREQGPFQRECL